MKRYLALVLALLSATGAAFAQGVVIIPATPVDLTPYMPRTEAAASISTLQAAIDAKAALASTYSKTQVDALLAPVSTAANVGAAAAPFARVKWAGQNLATNSSGVWTGTVPANRMTTGLSVSGLVVHTTGQFALPLVTATGSPTAGYSVTVTFSKAKPSITVPAASALLTATTLALFELQASTGVVSFDIGFAEPDVIGP